MVERSLSMREVPRSIPGFSNHTIFYLATKMIFAISEILVFLNLFVSAVAFFLLFLTFCQMPTVKPK